MEKLNGNLIEGTTNVLKWAPFLVVPITFDMNLVGSFCHMKIQECSSTVIFLCFMTKITSNIITHSKDIILTITNGWRQTESTDRRKHISGFFFSYNNTEKIHFSNNKHLFPLITTATFYFIKLNDSKRVIWVR